MLSGHGVADGCVHKAAYSHSANNGNRLAAGRRAFVYHRGWCLSMAPIALQSCDLAHICSCREHMPFCGCLFLYPPYSDQLVKEAALYAVRLLPGDLRGIK